MGYTYLNVRMSVCDNNRSWDFLLVAQSPTTPPLTAEVADTTKSEPYTLSSQVSVRYTLKGLCTDVGWWFVACLVM